jgi:hypothetical protein
MRSIRYKCGTIPKQANLFVATMPGEYYRRLEAVERLAGRTGLQDIAEVVVVEPQIVRKQAELAAFEERHQISAEFVVDTSAERVR